jgi:hypothetical protein
MHVQALTFDDEFEVIVGESEYSVLAFARTLTDPWSYLTGPDGVIADITTACLDQAYPQEFQAFVERVQDFLDTVDAALTAPERMELQYDRWDELDMEPNINSESYDPGYSPLQQKRDVWGIDRPEFIQPKPEFDSEYSSRGIWKRTKGHTTHTYGLTEWGTFSFDVTKRFAHSLLRVDWHMLHGKPYLRVGGVDISLLSGKCICRVSGCDWKRTLRYNPDSESTEFDREYAEFQVLSILQHLGEHTLKNPKNYWTPILEVKRFRDDKSKSKSKSKKVQVTVQSVGTSPSAHLTHRPLADLAQKLGQE